MLKLNLNLKRCWVFKQELCLFSLMAAPYETGKGRFWNVSPFRLIYIICARQMLAAWDRIKWKEQTALLYLGGTVKTESARFSALQRSGARGTLAGSGAGEKAWEE